MRRLCAAMAVALALLAGPPARAQQLVADIDNHLVAITTGFTGTAVTLFGSIDGGGDIIVVVRGPDRETVVRQKSRIAGIWLNTRSLAFVNVPSYYAVFATNPIETILPADVRQLHGIGIDALRLPLAEDEHPSDKAQTFRAALIANQQAAGLYANTLGHIDFLGEKLFRTTLSFPATVPTGTYSVQVFLVRKGDIVAAQTTPLIISQSGLEADINDFATNRAALYGLIAVLAAVMAGWGATLFFRSA